MCSPQVRDGYSVPLLEDRTFTYVVCNFSTQVSVFSLIYSFKYLFVSVQIQEHLFYTYLFCCLNCSSFGHWELFQLALVSLWHAPIIILFFSPFILFFFLFIMTKDYYPSEFPLV